MLEQCHTLAFAKEPRQSGWYGKRRSVSARLNHVCSAEKDRKLAVNPMCLDGDPSNPQPQPTPQPRPPQIPQPTPANVQRSLQSPISDLAAPATVDKVSTPSSTMRAKGSTIAERMRRFDSKPDVAKIDTKNEGSQMHRQSTDLKRRMNPFMRRDASGNPTGNQSETVPRGPQHQPDKTSAIASGDRARRDAIRGTRDTSWKTSSQRPPAMGDVSSFVLDTSRGDNEASNVRSGYGRRGSKYFEKGIKPIPDPIPPAGQIMCPQHGRKLKPKARAGPAIGGLDKGLNGAYIPSGRRIRHQVESTSPWFILANPLTKTEGTSVSPEPCVDCLAETEIKRREQSDHGAEAPMAEHGVGDAGLFIHDEHGSTTTEPGTPLDEAIKGPSIIGTADEHQTVNLPGAAVADARPHQIGTLVAADLGDMIDAIIIEHRGALEMVITNLKNGPPGRTEMDQLSNEMASVSDSLRSADTRTRAVLDHNQNFSIILDTPPEFLRSRTKSMPDLLDFVESAARELGVDLSRKQDRQPDRMEQPTIQIVASGDSHSTVSTPTAGGSNISLAPSSVRAASPVNAMTPFATPHDSPAGSPVLKASDGSGQKVVTPPDSTNISPSTVPPAPKIIQPDVTPAASVNASPDTIRPALDVAPAIPSQAVPTIEPSVVTHPSAPEEMMPVSIQPTTNAGDQPNNASTTSVQTIIPPVTTALPGGFPSTPVTESQPILPTMEAGSVTQPVPQAMVLPQATMDGSAPKPPSRIPSIKNLARTLTGPRKHLSATPTRAPWSRDSKAEWAAVKPSLVKEREKDLQDHLSTEARKSAS